MVTYGSEAGVEAINSHAVGGYTALTMPTSAAVADWLEQGASMIDNALAKAGYATPVASTAACYQAVVRLNNLYAAACAEQSVNISTAGPGEETRSEKLWKWYKMELTDFLSGDLTLIGLSLAATATTAPRKRVRSLPLRHYDGYAVNSDRADY